MKRVREESESDSKGDGDSHGAKKNRSDESSPFNRNGAGNETSQGDRCNFFYREFFVFEFRY